MKKKRTFLFFITPFLLSLCLVVLYNLNTNANLHVSSGTKKQLDDMIYMDLKCGRVVMKLFPKIAPLHVKRFKELVKSGFYDGLLFHRVIPGFVAQTGDPTGTGSGGSGKKLPLEPSSVSHVRGILSMARAAELDSADSQFFIVLADATFLDKQYTVFGKVVEGMDCVDKIKQGDEKNNGVVNNPDKIIKMTLAFDSEVSDAIKDSEK